jgi:hypothetical protein
VKHKLVVAVTAGVILMSAAALMGVSGCGNESVKAENDLVKKQQTVYNKTQPAPFFEYSLARDLWIQFYTAQNKAVSTWTYITDMTGQMRFETPSQGYPIPMDTQLTNPLQLLYDSSGAVVEQPEPNGLFTSKNTNATIIMALNSDGTFSPIYTEQFATAFPFRVHQVKDDYGWHWERDSGQTPTIVLKPKGQ